jgi:hypothetical protein
VLGWLVAGRMLRPLRTMNTAIKRISARNVHERLALRGPRDELRNLADTVDGCWNVLAVPSTRRSASSPLRSMSYTWSESLGPDRAASQLVRSPRVRSSNSTGGR